MPFFDGFELLTYAVDAECEEKLYLRWAIGYQFMMGFTEFKGKVVQTEDDRTEKEILDDVREIIG